MQQNPNTIFPRINTALRIVVILKYCHRDRELADIVAILEKEPHINIFITNIAMRMHVAKLLPKSVSSFNFSPMMGYQEDLYTDVNKFSMICHCVCWKLTMTVLGTR